MGPEEFRDLVRRLRDAQVKYFKTRERADLIASKDLERRIDVELGAEAKPGLFERQP